MATYCISYDLRKERAYEELYDKLKAYGTHSHTLESTWFVVTTKNAGKIRDELRKVIDKDDGLIVIEVVKNWASHGLRPSTNQWLKRNT